MSGRESLDDTTPVGYMQHQTFETKDVSSDEDETSSDSAKQSDDSAKQSYSAKHPNFVWEVRSQLETPAAQLGFVSMIRSLLPDSLFLHSHIDSETGEHIFRMLISSKYEINESFDKSPYPTSASLIYPSDVPENHCTHCLFIPLPRNLSLKFAETAMADKLYSFHGRLIEKSEDYKIVIPPAYGVKYHPCTACGIGRRSTSRSTDEHLVCFRCHEGVHTTEPLESHNGGCYIFFNTYVSQICIQLVRDALDGSHWGNQQKHIVSARWCRES